MARRSQISKADMRRTSHTDHWHSCIKWWTQRTGLKLTVSEDQSPQLHLSITEEWQAVSAVVCRFLNVSLSEDKCPNATVPQSTLLIVLYREIKDCSFLTLGIDLSFQIPKIPSRFLGTYFPDNHPSAHLKLWDFKSFSFLSSSEIKRLFKCFPKKRTRTTHIPAVRRNRWPLGHSQSSLAFP